MSSLIIFWHILDITVTSQAIYFSLYFLVLFVDDTMPFTAFSHFIVIILVCYWWCSVMEIHFFSSFLHLWVHTNLDYDIFMTILFYICTLYTCAHIHKHTITTGKYCSNWSTNILLIIICRARWVRRSSLTSGCCGHWCSWSVILMIFLHVAVIHYPASFVSFCLCLYCHWSTQSPHCSPVSSFSLFD